MADPTQTPDLQGAGLPAGQQDQSGLMDALRTQGSLPAMPGMQGPDPGLAFGSGMLSGLAGQQGNPYLAQQGQMQQQQTQQMFQLHQMEERRRATFLRENQMALTIAEHMTDNSDPEVKAHGWREISRLSGPLGVKIPPNIVARLGRGELSKESLATVIGYMDDGMKPEDIARLTGLDAQLVTQAAPIAQSDPTRRMLKIPTRAEAAAGKVKDQQEALKLARERWGLEPKDPRLPFALKYTQDTFGVPFNEATHDQQKAAVDASGAVALKIGVPTSLIKNALAEFNPTGDPNDPIAVKSAVNAYRAKRQFEGLSRAATQGQLSVMGRQFGAELNRINIAQDKLRSIDILVDDMNRLIAEGRSLHLTDNPQAANAIQQELVHWTGGPMSKGAAWYRAFATLDARFASVAQGIEQITGNRLAVQNVQRALAFHPKQTDPYTVQIRVASELQRAVANVRQAVGDDTARVLRQYQNAAGSAGVPFILGGDSTVESVEEEK